MFDKFVIYRIYYNLLMLVINMNNLFKNIMILSILILNMQYINSSIANKHEVTLDNVLEYIVEDKKNVVINGRKINIDEVSIGIEYFSCYGEDINCKLKDTSCKEYVYANYTKSLTKPALKAIKEYNLDKFIELVLNGANVDDYEIEDCIKRYPLIETICEDFRIFTKHPCGEALRRMLDVIFNNSKSVMIINKLLKEFNQIEIHLHQKFCLYDFNPCYFDKFFSGILSRESIFCQFYYNKELKVVLEEEQNNKITTLFKILETGSLHEIINALNEGMWPTSSAPKVMGFERSPFVYLEKAFERDKCSYIQKKIYCSFLIEYLRGVMAYDDRLLDLIEIISDDVYAYFQVREYNYQYLEPLKSEVINEKLEKLIRKSYLYPYAKEDQKIESKDLIIDQLKEKFLNAIGPYNNIKSTNLIDLIKYSIKFRNKLSPFMKNIEYLLPYSHYEFNINTTLLTLYCVGDWYHNKYIPMYAKNLREMLKKYNQKYLEKGHDVFFPIGRGNILSSAIGYRSPLAAFLVLNNEYYFFPPKEIVNQYTKTTKFLNSKKIMYLFRKNRKDYMDKFLKSRRKSCLFAIKHKQFKLLSLIIDEMISLRKTVSDNNAKIIDEIMLAVKSKLLPNETRDTSNTNNIKEQKVEKVKESVGIIVETETEEERELVIEISESTKNGIAPETEDDIMGSVRDFDDSYVTCLNLLSL